MYILPET